MSAGGRDEGFLTRWSRLKRDPAAAPAAGSVAADRPNAEASGGGEPALPEGRTLEDLVAELPNLDEIVAGQDLSAFMQAWVPGHLRAAALRRMWLIDPAIRDYVDPALDYAYDYNLPGGAPGYGPMETSAEMVREVREMFGRAIGDHSGVSEPIADANIASGKSAQDGDVVSQNLESSGERLLDRRGEEALEKPLESVESAPVALSPGHAAVQENQREAKHLRRATSRHGAALPD